MKFKGKKIDKAKLPSVFRQFLEVKRPLLKTLVELHEDGYGFTDEVVHVDEDNGASQFMAVEELEDGSPAPFSYFYCPKVGFGIIIPGPWKEVLQFSYQRPM